MNLIFKKGSSSDCIIGQIVRSKQGRDKGKHFIVYDFNEEYVFLVDGELRKISKPKKKKIIHIAKTNTYVEDFKEMKSLVDFNDAKVRKILNSYENREDS